MHMQLATIKNIYMNKATELVVGTPHTRVLTFDVKDLCCAVRFRRIVSVDLARDVDAVISASERSIGVLQQNLNSDKQLYFLYMWLKIPQYCVQLLALL